MEGSLDNPTHSLTIILIEHW